MRRQMALAGIAILLGSLTPSSNAAAQSKSEQSKTDSPEAVPPNVIKLYYAKKQLEKGRNLKTVIAEMSILVAREPKNAQYHLLLGCAYASRMASFACAIDDAKSSYGTQRIFQKRLKIWQTMQQNPALPLFGTPRPAAPPSASAPDDGKLYDPPGNRGEYRQSTITEEQKQILAELAEKERQTLAELAEKALNSFAAARELSRSLPKKEQIQIAYECGWGMLLLYRYGKENLPFEASASVKQKEENPASIPIEKLIEKPAEKEKKKEFVLRQKEMIACFQECTEYGEKKADYWQSLAFAYAPDYLLEIAPSDDIEKMTESKTNQVEKAVENLRRALKLKKDNAQLLYQIAIVSALIRPQESIDTLKKLTAVENPNAVCFYLLGDAQLNQATRLKGKEATQLMLEGIATVEAGNRAGDYRSIQIVLPVSKWIQSAWSYHPLYGTGSDSRCLDSVFWYLKGAAKEALENKQGERAMTIGTAMMELGLNALKHYKGDDLDPAYLRTQIMLYHRGFFGILACMQAHKDIQAAAKMSPSQANVLLANQYAQYKEYWMAWDSALIL